MSEVLLDCEATDSGPLSAIAIPKLGARSIAPEELVLDGEIEITNPAGDPREVLVGGDGPIDQHHHRGRVAVFIPEAPPQIEEAYGQILLALIPKPPQGPKDGHRVIVEGLDSHSPIEPALPVPLLLHGLRGELLGRQLNRLRKLILRQIIGQRKQRLSGFRLAHGNSSIVARICRIKSRRRRRSAWDSWE